eukprot:TRINITY_DN115527_c0_g1_i1.p1 TRINITY_DN115527_c0_g1~~TRINITY_DN115527_c0_g1_i1.p1  ORF type:complete len:133 (-),score=22.42 TRINITY_DN115527_c0_g1_i1:113-511(-)
MQIPDVTVKMLAENWQKHQTVVAKIRNGLRQFQILIHPDIPPLPKGDETTLVGTKDDEREKFLSWYRDSHCKFDGSELLNEEDSDYAKFGPDYIRIKQHAPDDSMKTDVLNYLAARQSSELATMLIDVTDIM